VRACTCDGSVGECGRVYDVLACVQRAGVRCACVRAEGKPSLVRAEGKPSGAFPHGTTLLYIMCRPGADQPIAACAHSRGLSCGVGVELAEHRRELFKGHEAVLPAAARAWCQEHAPATADAALQLTRWPSARNRTATPEVAARLRASAPLPGVSAILPNTSLLGRGRGFAPRRLLARWSCGEPGAEPSGVGSSLVRKRLDQALVQIQPHLRGRGSCSTELAATSRT